jgi:hypothetical protein
VIPHWIPQNTRVIPPKIHMYTKGIKVIPLHMCGILCGMLWYFVKSAVVFCGILVVSNSSVSILLPSGHEIPHNTMDSRNTRKYQAKKWENTHVYLQIPHVVLCVFPTKYHIIPCGISPLGIPVNTMQTHKYLVVFRVFREYQNKCTITHVVVFMVYMHGILRYTLIVFYGILWYTWYSSGSGQLSFAVWCAVMGNDLGNIRQCTASFTVATDAHPMHQHHLPFARVFSAGAFEPGEVGLPGNPAAAAAPALSAAAALPSQTSESCKKKYE